MFPYIGGKARQAKWITSFLPRTMDLYCEPFGGAFWNYIKGDFDAKTVVYNDFNKFMANLFACCQSPDKFLSHLKKIEAQDNDLFNKFKATVLETRENFNIPDYDIATMYIYLVTQTFSGMMSEKVKMVDLHGKYKSKYYAFINKLENERIRKRLEKIIVTHNSFEYILEQFDGYGKNYFYLDPPYYQKEHLYAFHEFGRASHEELARKLHSLKSRWILSYYEYEELNEWYPQEKYTWETKEYAKASMATKGKAQSVGTELLILNYSNIISI